jgi:hypothetical protein
MGDLIIPSRGGGIEKYDPEEGLKQIALAEVSERHFARAKDPKRLFEAIEAKISLQAEYVVWRGGKLIHGNGSGRGHKEAKKEIAVQKSLLPKADPGHVVAHRWAKSFCVKINKKWVIDDEKIAIALEEAQRRCLRICEQEKISTVRGTEGTGEFERYTPKLYADLARARC